ncbi:helix-hairpin-helix domain-containing protein [Eubacteriales bacterium KG127]
MKLLFRNLRFFLEDYNKYIRAGIIILTILIAALLFYMYGEKDKKLKLDINDEKKLIKEDRKDETNSSKEKNLKSTNSNENYNEKNNKFIIYVDIEGAVVNPGVYKVKEGDRVFHVIALAGGLKENADIISINKAEQVSDGQKIYIYEKGENNTETNTTLMDDKININSADVTKLQTIEGIGPSMASRIVEFRNKNGKFKSPEELKNVRGIGEKRYESIKDKIKI